MNWFNAKNNPGNEEVNLNQRGCWQSLFGYFGNENNDVNTTNNKEEETQNQNQISSSNEDKK